MVSSVDPETTANKQKRESVGFNPKRINSKRGAERCAVIARAGER